MEKLNNQKTPKKLNKCDLEEIPINKYEMKNKPRQNKPAKNTIQPNKRRILTTIRRLGERKMSFIF